MIVDLASGLPGRQAAGPGRPDRHLPPAVPRRRAHLLDLALGRRGPRRSTSPSRSTRCTQNLREVQPTLFFAVPRIWEKLHAGVADQGQRRHLVQAQGARLRAAAGRRDRQGQGRQRRQPHRRQPAALRRRLPARASGRSRSGSACAVPVRRLRRGADRARGARVLHRHRRPGLRALRDDREHRRGDRPTSRAG